MVEARSDSASERSPWPDNVPGAYFVDRRCVDCDTCRALAPDHFRRHAEGGYSYVFHQPSASHERALVDEALDCCPVSAISRRRDRSADERTAHGS